MAWLHNHLYNNQTDVTTKIEHSVPVGNFLIDGFSKIRVAFIIVLIITYEMSI